MELNGNLYLDAGVAPKRSDEQIAQVLHERILVLDKMYKLSREEIEKFRPVVVDRLEKCTDNIVRSWLHEYLCLMDFRFIEITQEKPMPTPAERAESGYNLSKHLARKLDLTEAQRLFEVSPNRACISAYSSLITRLEEQKKIAEQNKRRAQVQYDSEVLVRAQEIMKKQGSL